MVEFWVIAKANCESNCRYGLYKCIEWSYILHSLCTCNNFQKKSAKVDFYFIEFSAMIVKKINKKNILHLRWSFSSCKKHFIDQIFTKMVFIHHPIGVMIWC